MSPFADAHGQQKQAVGAPAQPLDGVYHPQHSHAAPPRFVKTSTGGSDQLPAPLVHE